jgi:signal transduction histidine kinase
VPVRIAARRDGARLTLDIVDSGEGMTAEFVRDTLFRPLVSGKPGGSGIGAWQARDLLRNAGGDLVALSQRGVGTTMRLTIPLGRARTGRWRHEQAEAPGRGGRPGLCAQYRWAFPNFRPSWQ